MNKPSNLVALLSVAGGIGAAALPSAARANCSPSGSYGNAGAIANPYAGQDNRPPVDLAAEYRRGVAAFEAGDFRTAKSAMATVLPYAGKQAVIYYVAGASRMGLGEHKAALKLLQKAVAYDADFLIAQRDLAIAYAKTGDIAKAQAMLATMEARAISQTGADAEPMLAAITAIKAAMPA